MDETGRITLRDLYPGTYRLRVGDWFGSTGGGEGYLHERTLQVPSPAGVVQIRLGGGAITGRIRLPEKSRRGWDVMAIGTKDGARLHHAPGDSAGNFCLRYLEPDTYRIVAHADGAGWASLGEVRVDSNLTDLGEKELAPGATITGTIEMPQAAAMPTRVVAVDESGFTVDAGDFRPVDGATYTIRGLWPGQWRVRLERDEAVLVERQAEVVGTESVTLDLPFEVLEQGKE